MDTPPDPARLHLGGDIGGTKTLLALGDGARPAMIERYENDDHASFEALLDRFLRDTGTARGAVAAACLAIAAPITGTRAQLTNRADWTLDADALGAQLGAPVRLINDFAGIGHGLPSLAADEIATLQPGTPVPDAARLAIGPGTGLGVVGIAGGRVIPSEGGHIGFAPTDGTQADLWRFLGGEHRRVTNERVCSGSGLAACYNYCLMRSGHALDPDIDPAEVTRRADAGADDARRALELFTQVLGAVAGDLAMTFLAVGGVYLVGGIPPKILPYLRTGHFLAGFNAKSEHQALVGTMPVHVVLCEQVGLRGAYAAARSGV